MKTLRQTLFASVLGIVLSTSAFAGDISGGFTVNRAGDISGGKTAQTSGDISGGLARTSGDISGGLTIYADLVLAVVSLIG